MDAEEAIKGVYGESRNGFTPYIIEYGWVEKNEVAYELSKGYSYYSGHSDDNKYLVGVSIVRRNLVDEWVKSIQDSKLFTSKASYNSALKKARKYIRRLKNEN